MGTFNRGTVFHYLQSDYDTFALCKALNISFKTYLCWLAGAPIPERKLNAALSLFGVERSRYDRLCSVTVDRVPR